MLGHYSTISMGTFDFDLPLYLLVLLHIRESKSVKSYKTILHLHTLPNTSLFYL